MPANASQLFTLLTDSTDGWAPLALPGTYPHVIESEDAAPRKVLQVLTPETLATLAATPIPTGGILIDYDHESFDSEGSTEAGGWIEALRIKDGRLEMNVRWSTGGRTALEGGNFRFISPSWDRAEPTPGTITPTKLLGAALTNRPNLGNLPALSNRAPTTTLTTMNLTALLKLLGLADSATEADAAAAIEKLKADAAAAKTTAEATAADMAALNNRHTTLLNEIVEKDLTEFAGVIHNRENIKAALLKDRPGTRALLSGLKAPEPAAPIHNRRHTGQPAPVTADKSAMQKAKVDQIRAATPGLSFNQAWEAARAADPALFQA